MTGVFVIPGPTHAAPYASPMIPGQSVFPGVVLFSEQKLGWTSVSISLMSPCSAQSSRPPQEPGLPCFEVARAG
eukprot:10840674-Lingulodinium_polyedra.AAC.1